MADPMRIRAQAAGDKATVRVLMSHEMETGQRKDSAASRCRPGSSRRSRPPQRQAGDDGGVGPVDREEPVPAVHRKGAKAGDKITISWVDNRGDKRSDEATVS